MSKNSVGKVPCTVDEVVYVHRSWSIQDLEGKILTFIDASISDPVQRKAMKDMLSPTIWRWASESDMSSYYELKSISVGDSNRGMRLR